MLNRRFQDKTGRNGSNGLLDTRSLGQPGQIRPGRQSTGAQSPTLLSIEEIWRPGADSMSLALEICSSRSSSVFLGLSRSGAPSGINRAPVSSFSSFHSIRKHSISLRERLEREREREKVVGLRVPNP